MILASGDKFSGDASAGRQVSYNASLRLFSTADLLYMKVAHASPGVSWLLWDMVSDQLSKYYCCCLRL